MKKSEKIRNLNHSSLTRSSHGAMLSDMKEADNTPTNRKRTMQSTHDKSVVIPAKKGESHVLFLLLNCSSFLRLVNTAILFRGTKSLSLFGIVFYLLNEYCHCFFPTTSLRRLNGKPIFTTLQKWQ